MTVATILWRRLDRRGHERAMLEELEGSWRLTGDAVFLHESEPCALSYAIVCDRAWVTLSTRVTGWLGIKPINVTVDRAGELPGCIDIDLNFSPSTNLLPIRRLNLAVGESAPVRAAWLRFPSFKLEPLEQTYTRLAANKYRYESAGGRFVAEIELNETGFATRYGDIWQAE